MSNQQLFDFVGIAKEKGTPDDALVALLRQQGWQERTIYQALGEYYARTLGIEVPSRGSRAENARDAFLYLLWFIALGAWVFALIQLGDAVVDHVLDVQTYAYYVEPFRQAIAGYLATIIVAFPIYVWIGATIARIAKHRPEARDSEVRKWLTYIALVVTASVLMGDAIWFLNDFLRGELTLAFVLKTIVLGVVTGGVLLYHLASVKSPVSSPALDRAFAIGSIAAVLAAIVAGFIPLGTPNQEGAFWRDQRRVSDLAAIAQRLHVNFGTAGKALPSEYSASPERDPQTQAPYAYQRVDRARYRLCASFERSSDNSISEWSHPAGEHCFDLNAGDAAPPAI